MYALKNIHLYTQEFSDYRPIFIIRKKNAYKIENFGELIEKYKEYDPIVVDLDDMKLNPNFPWLNKTGDNT